ncbi:MAG TPA: acetate/propionate family kinase [Solirubrobacteraceae bacterium]|nr:acetate/propionate family kinase [Solirubrobacteraceae bacterium]
MIALALNAGSSTLKTCLYRLGSGIPLAAPPAPVWERQVNCRVGAAGDDSAAELLGELWRGPDAPLSGPEQIDVVGHRIVHGGTRYTSAIPIGDDVKRQITELAVLAPLHNLAAVNGIEAAERNVPGTPQVAVFDTAFHASLPVSAYTYAGPREWMDAGLRRFGFHGINHEYAAHRTARILDRSLDGLRLLTCHLGSGASLAAVRDGRSVDTTMGFTPLDGLAMATRSGSVDPGLLLHLLRSGETSPDELYEVLNRGSGLAGLSGTGGDMRDVLAARERGDPRAGLAFDVYVHRLHRCMGAMLPSLGGLDAIAFTGGVGEHSAAVRRAALTPFAFLGVDVDEVANGESAADVDIATPGSRVRVVVIRAREEWAVARTAADVVTERDVGA